MTKYFVSLCLALVFIPSPSLEAREVPIGTHDAVLTLDESWQRQTLVQNLGPDQFIHQDGVFMILIESEVLNERRVDFEVALETVIAGIEASSEGMTPDSAFQFRRQGDIGHATRKLEAIIQSMEVAYQIDLVSRDGLGYMVMTWSTVDQAQLVETLGSELAMGIAFPDAESAWGLTAESTTHTFRFDDWKIAFDYRESVFPDLKEQEDSRSLSSSDSSLALHLFLDQLDNIDLESALDQIIGIVDDDSSMEELERFDLDSEAGPGRQVLLRNTEGTPFDVVIAMIEVEANTFVDLRMVSVGATGHRDRLWTTILDSLRVTPPSQLDAFPIVEKTSTVEDASALNAAALEFITQGSRVETGDTSISSVIPREGQPIIVLEPYRILSVTGEGEASVLYRSEDWIGNAQLASVGDQLLLVSDDEVSQIVDRQLEPADFEAQLLAARGDDLILTRQEKPSQMVGFSNLARSAPSQLITRTLAGEEHVVTEFANSAISALAPSVDLSTALVATRQQHPLGLSNLNEDDHELLEIVLETAEQRPLGGWQEIRQIAAAETGWLVGGTPKNGLPGLYLLDSDGSPELLISGEDSVGYSLRDGTLSFTVNLCLDSEGEATNNCLYLAPIEVVRAHGPMYSPLPTDVLNQIAEELATQGLALHHLASQSELSAFVKAAEEAYERHTSSALPASPKALDRLFGDLTYDHDLSHRAIELLAAMVSHTLTEDGAEWIGCQDFEDYTRPVYFGLIDENPFAIALQPVEAVISSIYRKNGWWNLMESLPKKVKGRALLVGCDNDVLKAETKQRDRPAILEHLAQGNTTQLLALLQEDVDNVFIRARIYLHLASAGKGEDLVQLSRGFATSDEPVADDLGAWLAGRLHMSPEDEELERLIADTKTAIAAHPEQPALYLILAEAYQRTNLADGQQLAQICYSKVTDLVSHGEFYDAATTAIERIDSAEDQ